jgi:hypothetical protein
MRRGGQAGASAEGRYFGFVTGSSLPAAPTLRWVKGDRVLDRVARSPLPPRNYNRGLVPVCRRAGFLMLSWDGK